MRPGFLPGNIDQFVAFRADAGTQNGQNFRIPLADVKRGVHDAGPDEGGIPHPEDSLLPIDPLLDLAFEDVNHLLLIGMLMEIVTARGREVHFQDHEVLRG